MLYRHIFLQHHIFNNITRLIEMLDSTFELWEKDNNGDDIFNYPATTKSVVHDVINRAKTALISCQQSMSKNNNNRRNSIDSIFHIHSTAVHNTETAITNVPAVGSSNYSSIDASPLSGVNYYRLKIVNSLFCL